MLEKYNTPKKTNLGILRDIYKLDLKRTYKEDKEQKKKLIEDIKKGKYKRH